MPPGLDTEALLALADGHHARTPRPPPARPVGTW
ncbi:hypothetical protein SMD44_08757 [Streptomyces alboflavus]|uniref:Uncharacterized protein n=1 Tax=Streptomyces alboflavus TaxID=67267 RepID=A0A1Z1WS60_9ACTN|nr:hypothetical protein SMD44_08757 [Streptomyces alboflavus]